MLDAGVKWVNYEDLDLSQLRERSRAFREDYMKQKGPEVYDFYQNWIKHVEQSTGRSQGAAAPTLDSVL